MQTGLSAWILAIVKALEDAGIDPPALMRDIDMDASRVGDLGHRYSQDQVTSLWIAAVEATGDPNFGLKVARHIRPSTFHVVGYAMSCSATLRRAAERFSHSARLISDSAAVSFQREEEGYRLTVDLNTGGRQPIYQTIDTMLAGFFLLCEWILSTSITPVEVSFRHRKPADDQAYRDVFRCPIRYGQPINSILFPVEILERPVPSANEELATMLDEMAAKYLAFRFASRFSRKVRDTLIGQLPNGEPSKQETARLLAMTERTLLRRLREENTTFQEVLDRLREELAYDYLRRPDLTVENVAYLLGFSSSSTFSRAFMRWTAQRPSVWREARSLADRSLADD
ncbi:AraC family transcriptional regulator [Sphingobium cupriresistens]|uniref:AraC family transcriptional regulator n=1 Tax=Sphingobium cupriresistens LL01 TaxID=1420583 RepID=A0A0J8AVF4_9SPHN|nr:AraC family transcriptional regulator [Sphingobium cupriresistens]KMS58185.1 AraC family transcriptional regulator [Sphingobium cupriresistens LL01]